MSTVMSKEANGYVLINEEGLFFKTTEVSTHGPNKDYQHDLVSNIQYATVYHPRRTPISAPTGWVAKIPAKEVRRVELIKED